MNRYLFNINKPKPKPKPKAKSTPKAKRKRKKVSDDMRERLLLEAVRSVRGRVRIA